MNEYVSAERASRYKGAEIKRKNEEIIMLSIRQQLRGVHIRALVEIYYVWVVQNERTDRDNIAFAKKFIQDALVSAGVLIDDGWKYVVGFSDRFEVDKNNPKIEVILREVE